MSLIPAGKRKMMFAQTDPSLGEFESTGIDPNQITMYEGSMPQDPMAEEIPSPENEVDQLETEVDEINQEQEMPEEGNDIRHLVFDFLVTLGYPPRRLHEFKSQFVSETGTADSGTQVTIVVPDEVYGKNVQIPRNKIKELVQSVEQEHGLSFQNYERKNEQLTLNFISSDAAEQEAMDDEGPGDVLDKVYRKPSKEAKTIRELIKESKDKQKNLLKRVLGDQK